MYLFPSLFECLLGHFGKHSKWRHNMSASLPKVTIILNHAIEALEAFQHLEASNLKDALDLFLLGVYTMRGEPMAKPIRLFHTPFTLVWVNLISVVTQPMEDCVDHLNVVVPIGTCKNTDIIDVTFDMISKEIIHYLFKCSLSPIGALHHSLWESHAAIFANWHHNDAVPSRFFFQFIGIVTSSQIDLGKELVASAMMKDILDLWKQVLMMQYLFIQFTLVVNGTYHFVFLGYCHDWHSPFGLIYFFYNSK